MTEISLLKKFEEHQVDGLQTIAGGNSIDCIACEITHADGSTEGSEIDSTGHETGSWTD